MLLVWVFAVSCLMMANFIAYQVSASGFSFYLVYLGWINHLVDLLRVNHIVYY